MCEIFPEVESCCFVASIRVGMLLIAVLSITSGALTLGVVEQRTNVGYDKVMNMYENATKIKDSNANAIVNQAMSMLSGYIAATISAVSVFFMIGGILLLFANFTDQEGVAQIFVWLIFLCIVIMSFLVLAIGLECITQSVCLLGHMDWLTAAATLILMIFYIIVWFYFICVVNSYVLNGYT